MQKVSATHLFAVLLTVAASTVALGAHAQTVDVAAAEKLLTDNKCAKCHSVDKQKDGPAYQKTAAKYKGKADAEAKLYTHLTTSPMVEIDGVKEEHFSIKSKDQAGIKNAVRYILSR